MFFHCRWLVPCNYFVFQTDMKLVCLVSHGNGNLSMFCIKIVSLDVRMFWLLECNFVICFMSLVCELIACSLTTNFVVKVICSDYMFGFWSNLFNQLISILTDIFIGWKEEAQNELWAKSNFNTFRQKYTFLFIKDTITVKYWISHVKNIPRK